MKISTVVKSFAAAFAAVVSFSLSAQNVEAYIPADSDMMFVMDGTEAMKNPCTKGLIEKAFAMVAENPQFKNILSMENMNAKTAAGITLGATGPMGVPQMTMVSVADYTTDVAEKAFSEGINFIKAEKAKEDSELADIKIEETTIDGKKAYSFTADETKIAVLLAGPRQIQSFVSNIPDAKFALIKPGKAPVTLPKNGILLVKFELAKIMKKAVPAEMINEGEDPTNGVEAVMVLLSSADKDVKLNISCRFKDAKTAADTKVIVDQMIELYKQNPEMAAFAGKLNIVAKDKFINAAIVLSQADIDNLVGQATMMFMPMMMNGGDFEFGEEIDEE